MSLSNTALEGITMEYMRRRFSSEVREWFTPYVTVRALGIGNILKLDFLATRWALLVKSMRLERKQGIGRSFGGHSVHEILSFSGQDRRTPWEQRLDDDTHHNRQVIRYYDG